MTDRQLTEQYAEAVTRLDVPRRLVEIYAETVTTYQRARLLTEIYAETVTSGTFPRAGGFDGWGIPL